MRDNDEIVTRYREGILAIGVNYNVDNINQGSRSPLATLLVYTKDANQTLFAHHITNPVDDSRLYKIVDIRINPEQELIYIIGQYQGQKFGKEHFQRFQ